MCDELSKDDFHRIISEYRLIQFQNGDGPFEEMETTVADQAIDEIVELSQERFEYIASFLLRHKSLKSEDNIYLLKRIIFIAKNCQINFDDHDVNQAYYSLAWNYSFVLETIVKSYDIPLEWKIQRFSKYAPSEGRPILALGKYKIGEGWIDPVRIYSAIGSTMERDPQVSVEELLKHPQGQIRSRFPVLRFRFKLIK